MRLVHLKKIFSCIVIALLIASSVNAQQNIYNWRFTVYGGYMNYSGDIKTDFGDIDFSSPDYGFELSNFITNSFCWQLNYLNGTITGNDLIFDDNNLVLPGNSNVERGLNFKTEIHDISFRLAYFTDNNTIFYNSAFISPYIFAGIGRTNFTVYSDLYYDDSKQYYYYDNGIYNGPEGSGANTITQDGVFETNVSSLNTEGVDYSNYAWNIPVGLGLKFRISERLNADIKGEMRYYFTDYLDDVSGMYPQESISSYASNPTATDNLNRGNPDNKNDNTFMLSLSLSWNFGEKQSDFYVYPIQAYRNDSIDYELIGIESIAEEISDSTTTTYIYRTDTIPTGDSIYVAMMKQFDLDTISIDTVFVFSTYDSLFYEPVYAMDTVYTYTDSFLQDSTIIKVESFMIDSSLLEYAEKHIAIDTITPTLVYSIDTLFSDTGKYPGDFISKVPVYRMQTVLVDSLTEPFNQTSDLSTDAVAQNEVRQITQPNISDSIASSSASNTLYITPSENGNSFSIANGTDTVVITMQYPPEQTARTTDAGTSSTRSNERESENTPTQYSGSASNSDGNAEIQKSLNEIKLLIIGSAIFGGVSNNKSNKNSGSDSVTATLDSTTLQLIDSLLTSMQQPLPDTTLTIEADSLNPEIALQDNNVLTDGRTLPEDYSSTYDNSNIYTKQNTLLLNSMLIEMVAIKSELAQLRNQQQNASNNKIRDTVYINADNTSQSLNSESPGRVMVFYKTGKTQPDESELSDLDKIITYMNINKTYSVKISGYADKTGSASANKSLTQKRANVVKDYFIKKGIPENRIIAIGYGDVFSPSGVDAQSRRVEVELIK